MKRFVVDEYEQRAMASSIVGKDLADLSGLRGFPWDEDQATAALRALEALDDSQRSQIGLRVWHRRTYTLVVASPSGDGSGQTGWFACSCCLHQGVGRRRLADAVSIEAPPTRHARMVVLQAGGRDAQAQDGAVPSQRGSATAALP